MNLRKKICRGMSTYPNAYVKNENEFSTFSSEEMGSSLISIWPIQFQVSYTEFENPKNPGIQPSDTT